MDRPTDRIFQPTSVYIYRERDVCCLGVNFPLLWQDNSIFFQNIFPSFLCVIMSWSCLLPVPFATFCGKVSLGLGLGLGLRQGRLWHFPGQVATKTMPGNLFQNNGKVMKWQCESNGYSWNFRWKCFRLQAKWRWKLFPLFRYLRRK